MLSSRSFLGLLLAQFLTSFPTKAPPCLSYALSLTYIHHMVAFCISLQKPTDTEDPHYGLH